MGLYLALAWTPKFRFQVLHIVEDKEKLSLQHDADSLMFCPSPVRNFMSYYTLKQAALDVEFRGGEEDNGEPYPQGYQEDESNPHENDTPDEPINNPPL
jgi:hypothetical protein